MHPDQPVKNVQELVAFLKANSSKSNYASAGSGTANQIAAELLKRAANVPDVVHVPYKGSTPSAQAVLANEVNFSFLSMPPAVSNIAAGKMRGLAITSAKRVPAVGDVPTMIESGFPASSSSSTGVSSAPSGTPKPIIDKLNAEFTKAVASEEVKAAFAKIGAEPIQNTPAELRAMMEKDISRLAPVVKASERDHRLTPASVPGTLRRVRLIVFPGGFNWPVWVAQAKGLFAGNGIDVAVTPTPGSVYQLTGLVEGRFDMAITLIDNVSRFYREGQGEVPVRGLDLDCGHGFGYARVSGAESLCRRSARTPTCAARRCRWTHSRPVMRSCCSPCSSAEGLRRATTDWRASAVLISVMSRWASAGMPAAC